MDAAEAGGTLVGRYRLREVLGRGGMGTVWLASDEVLARDVAVKEIRWPAQLADIERDNLRLRAMREAQTAARLDHPNIARVYDVVEHDGRPWIVMQLIPYPSLRDVVLEDGPLPPQRAAQIGLGVLAAIRAAHDAGVLHRDVKPGNILLGPDDHPVLTDFGMAIADGSPTLTASGLLIGSPSYMAPERARGEPATPAADMWALGATLYAAVEGRPPFDREGALAVLTAVVSMDPDPSGHSGPLWPVISGLLRKDPARRLDAVGAQRLLGRVADGSAALESTAPLNDAGQASRTLTGLPLVDAAGSPEREVPEPEGTAGSAGLAVVSRGPEEPPGLQEPAEREEPSGLEEPSEPDGPPGLDEPAGVSPESEVPAEPEALAEPEIPAELEALAEPEIPAESEVVAEPEMSSELEAPAEPEVVAEPGTSAEAEAPPQPPVPAGPGRGGDLWPPRLSRRWLLAGAGGLAAAAAVAGVVLLLPGSGPGHSQAAPPARPSSSSSHRAARPTATGSASASARSNSSAADGASNVLPAGFTWYHDPTGFSIGMPDGWHVSHQGHYVYIQNPDSSQFLIVDQTDQPQANALEDWRQQEAARASTYSGYHRIELRAVQYAQAEQAADWEWTYYDSGRLTQVLNRNILVDSHQAYALYWSTPQAQWQASYHYFQAFAATFHPVGIPG